MERRLHHLHRTATNNFLLRLQQITMVMNHMELMVDSGGQGILSVQVVGIAPLSCFLCDVCVYSVVLLYGVQQTAVLAILNASHLVYDSLTFRNTRSKIV